MRITPTPAQVRKIASTHLVNLGASRDEVADLEETILFDGGRCAARSYTVEGYFAMWLIPAGVLQFYTDEGDMLLTVKLFEEATPVRAAA